MLKGEPFFAMARPSFYINKNQMKKFLHSVEK